MSSSRVQLQLEHFQIPLQEILRATQNFGAETLIGNGEFGNVYKGQLSKRWQNRSVAIKRFDLQAYQGHDEFVYELEMVSKIQHQNIIPFIGYCDEDNEMIVVYEYAVNGSLDDYLQNPEKRSRLSWAQRLKICIGAARGLEYLHSGLGVYRIVHRNVKSASILLDENLEAKICDFGLSRKVPTNVQQHTQMYTKVAGTNFYMDPIYYERGRISKESDIYSFGVVLFELLTGMMAYHVKMIGDLNPQPLMNLVRDYQDEGLEKLIDPYMITQIDARSFHKFEEIAYHCISFKLKERPSANHIIKWIEIALDFQLQNQEAASAITIQSHQYQNLESFLIPLEEIRLATHDFSHETRIGDGEFGVIYKGKLSQQWQNRNAAFKRYHRTGGFGEEEFHNEVKMISSFNHENIIHFIGYCDEGSEMIIVSEYASNGSLDQHLQDPIKISCITWMQRLKICLGAAKALKYLHSGIGEESRVIHRDVTSANVLLDDNLDAKVCGFHLSLLVHQNQRQVYENVVGTEYYLDPVYNESGIVETNSDVYSFGVILFEMLSGMLACQGRSIDDDEPQKLINLVRRYYDDGLDRLNDPNIRVQINIRSFHVFKEIAYQCLSWNSNDRPTMNMIIRRIEDALDIQSPRADSSITMRSHKRQNLQNFLIPLEEIRLATGDFNPETRIRQGAFGVVYKGQLSDRWQNRTATFKRLDRTGGFGENEFLNEVKMMSTFNHANIIPFIGFCDEGNEKILVYEYAINGTLADYLQDPDKIRFLTWAQRLKICIGAARGLNHLHSGLGEDNRPQVYASVEGTRYYLDPIYNESGILKIESDIYSYGVMLFEMLNGMLACEKRSIGDNKPQTLINLVRRYYDEGPDTLIDPLLRGQINILSLHSFKKIAYRCISLNLKDRPTSNRIIKRIEEALNIQSQIHGAPSTITTQSQQLESFLIPLKDIKLATREFNPENLIGDGGFGTVYKGQLSKDRKNCIDVAIKRLNLEGHQGKKEFLSELKLIANFHHQNIIPFVGYCEEDKEMIIVSRYAINRSLDHHLHNPSKRRLLTWAQRLKICLGAAKGLDYLHSGLGKDHQVIHRDVKSGNILLDENLDAKICDFGLSKEGLGTQQLTHVFTKAAGTNFYLDPVYQESGILSKKSDVYSFGVVLFEILSGAMSYVPTKFVDGSPQYLINLVRRYYNEGPEKLFDPIIKDQVGSRCFHIFKELAYQCISLNSKERPTMDTIIDRIEDAMDFQ
ncbi:unnamed protein product [Lactuca saligna]|uniref:non-specific serine/threonine protein kinase n=1 Tax=Lactuca saligna TaxID=75948 RepID=A0AA35YC26_LACSI|nr:unnamed protein product [Lactuca saligna]